MTFAGLPPTKLISGTNLVTTLPADITEQFPMLTPGNIIEPVPIQTSSPITTGLLPLVVLILLDTLTSDISGRDANLVLPYTSPFG